MLLNCHFRFVQGEIGKPFSKDRVDYYEKDKPKKTIRMKQMIQKLLILVVGLSVGINAFAYDFEVDGIYYNITSLTEVTVTSNGRNSYSGNVVIPEQVTYGDNTYSVTSIGDRVFYYCSALTSVTIPDSVTSIGDSAFAYCSALTFVTIPDSVISIGNYAFGYCSALTSVTIPDSVTFIGERAFCGCYRLTSVTIPDSVTFIGNYAFSYCSALTSVTIPDGVTSIGNFAFSDCYRLTSVTIPNSVTSIGDSAFRGCIGLTSLTIPDSVISIGDGVFLDCQSLTSVTIGNSVTSISDSAFSCCHSLTSVTIPDCVTSIGDSAFHNCTGLTSVTIPDSVTSIGYSAFFRCFELTSVTIPDSVTSIGNYAFDTAMTRLKSRAEVPPACDNYALAYINKQTCELFVPIKSLDAYKAADQWKEFVFITGVDFDKPGSVGDAVSENGGVHVAANNGSIEITGADNAVKTVYNTNGQLVYSGTGTTISVPENGIYIVRVKGQTFKVAL